MMAAKQAAWLVVMLVSLACSGWYFASTSSSIKLDARTLSTTNDMTVHQLTVRQFDAQGQLANYLTTPLLHHIPEKNTHWLKNPKIVITQKNQPAWEINADEATSLLGGQEITLNKNVVIHQNQGKTNEASSLKTEAITYFPKDKFATTPLDVTFEQMGSTVQAKGMDAYLAEKRVKLLSQARGTYVPKRG